MSKSSRLVDQSTELFPFNRETYERITEEFDTIEHRFRSLQHSGNVEAKRLGDLAAQINGQIWELWSAIVEAEDRERAAETKTAS